MDIQSYNTTFWNRIKTLCKEKHILKRDLALQSGITEATLYRQIGLNNCPPIHQIFAMSRVLGVSLEYLATGSVDNPLQEDINNLKNTLNKIHEIASL